MCENAEEASFEKATVTIKFTDKAKDTYAKFTGDSPEQAVRHVKLFYSIASKMDFEVSHKTFSQLATDRVSAGSAYPEKGQKSLPSFYQCSEGLP